MTSESEDDSNYATPDEELTAEEAAAKWERAKKACEEYDKAREAEELKRFNDQFPRWDPIANRRLPSKNLILLRKRRKQKKAKEAKKPSNMVETIVIEDSD